MSKQTPYKFTVSSGMAGYMPNYLSTLVAHTRKELSELIRDELDMLEYPANRFRDFEIKRMWRFIQIAKSGSSCHSQCNPHNGEHISINGLTDAEYEEQRAIDEIHRYEEQRAIDEHPFLAFLSVIDEIHR